jgi:hypothetical protein
MQSIEIQKASDYKELPLKRRRGNKNFQHKLEKHDIIIFWIEKKNKYIAKIL